MNENLGTKGGKQDRKRSYLRIRKKKKKQLTQKEYDKKQQEKELKKIQLQTLIKILPIVVVGETYKVLTDKPKAKDPKNSSKKEKLAEKEFIPSKKEEETHIENKPKVEVKKVTQDKIEIKKTFITETLKQTLEKKQQIATQEQKTQSIDNDRKNTDELQKNIKEVPNKKIPIIVAPMIYQNNQIKRQEENNNIDPKKDNSLKQSNSLEKLKLNTFENIKLIEAYQDRLKSINYELKKLTFEYKSIEKSLNNIYTEKEAEELFERLNLVIRKLEELKSKLKIDNINKYDDNYIYNLINEYMESFNDKKTVKEIKDSDLYILLSTKIEELDKEKDKLSEKITSKKEKFGISEKKLKMIKEKYSNYDDFNKKLIEFENKQELLLKNLEEKIKTSTEIHEKTRLKVVAIENQSNDLLNLLALQMMIPGLKSVKSTAIATIAYLHFMKKVMRPKYDIKREKYKIIKVTDYRDKIEQGLTDINSISNVLEKTTTDLNKMITEFKTEYSDFFSQIPECNKILNNLLRLKNNLEEKEYELEQIKKQQLINLEKNNEKIKKLNNKEVM